MKQSSLFKSLLAGGSLFLAASFENEMPKTKSMPAAGGQ